jgi:trehalose 2-sulfotransferase
MSRWDQFGSEYDYPPFYGTPKCYMIASTPRSGSHYLAHLLSVCGDLGSPLEYLNPRRQQTWRGLLGTSNWTDTFKAQMRRRVSPSGWFGLKTHWDHFNSVRTEPGMDALLQFGFIIRIKREDTIGQAVSFAIALQTNAWNSATIPECNAEYDFSTIRNAFNEIAEQNSKWDAYLASARIQPMDVTYEELVASPDFVVQSIRNYLGAGPLGTSKHRPSPQRQANELNESWRLKYLADLSLATAQGLV